MNAICPLLCFHHSLGRGDNCAVAETRDKAGSSKRDVSRWRQLYFASRAHRPMHWLIDLGRDEVESRIRGHTLGLRRLCQ